MSEPTAARPRRVRDRAQHSSKVLSWPRRVSPESLCSFRERRPLPKCATRGAVKGERSGRDAHGSGWAQPHAWRERLNGDGHEISRLASSQASTTFGGYTLCSTGLSIVDCGRLEALGGRRECLRCERGAWPPAPRGHAPSTEALAPTSNRPMMKARLTQKCVKDHAPQ